MLKLYCVGKDIVKECILNHILVYVKGETCEYIAFGFLFPYVGVYMYAYMSMCMYVCVGGEKKNKYILIYF